MENFGTYIDSYKVDQIAMNFKFHFTSIIKIGLQNNIFVFECSYLEDSYWRGNCSLICSQYRLQTFWHSFCLCKWKAHWEYSSKMVCARRQTRGTFYNDESNYIFIININLVVNIYYLEGNFVHNISKL